jgi:hypothetical protein
MSIFFVMAIITGESQAIQLNNPLNLTLPLYSDILLIYIEIVIISNN